MPDDKKDARAAWDDAADDEAKASGVSPAVAKALLAMNPSLRSQGLDTMKVVRQSQDAGSGKKPAATKTAGAAPAASGAGVYDSLKALDADVRKREAEITARMAELDKEKKTLLEQSREQICQWLLKNDPDILSPVSQSALKDFETLLNLVGFKTADYVNKYRKKR